MLGIASNYSALIPIVVIYLIRMAPSYFAKKPTQKPPKPLSKYEKYSFYALLVLSASLYVLVFYPPRTLFSEIQVVSNESGRRISSAFAYRMKKSVYSEPKREYLNKVLEYVVNRDIESREFYSLFGDSVIHCNWCSEKNDYIIYSLPSMLLSYSVFLTVFGLFSDGVRISWRNYALQFAIMIFFIEIGYKLAYFEQFVDVIISLFDNFDRVFDYLKFDTESTLLWRFRFISLSFITLCAAFFPKTNVWTTEDTLKVNVY
jgi:hypothetical protein